MAIYNYTSERYKTYGQVKSLLQQAGKCANIPVLFNRGDNINHGVYIYVNDINFQGKQMSVDAVFPDVVHIHIFMVAQRGMEIKADDALNQFINFMEVKMHLNVSRYYNVLTDGSTETSIYLEESYKV